MKSWLGLCVLLAAAATPLQASAAAGPQRANIVLTKTADASTVEAGGIAGYALTVSNTGRGTGEGIDLQDSLPTLPGVSWVMTSAVSGCGVQDRLLDCQIPYLRGGQSLSAHLITSTTLDSCGVLSNTATLTTTEGISTTVGPVTISLHCKASPKLTTAASPPTGVPNQALAVFDAATLSGCANNLCSGSVTFALVGPNSCVTLALGPATLPVVNNAAKAIGITGVLPAGDYYWITTYSGDGNNNPVNPPIGCGDPNELFQMPPLSSPTISSVASPHSATVGQVFAPKDTAFLAGCFANLCTGTITLAVVGPNSCSTIALGPGTFPVNANSVSTPGIWTPAAPGNYYWTASYSGDQQNNPVSPAVGCGDSNELIHVGAETQLGTVASPQIVTVGQPVSVQDTGILSACFNNTCTGTVTFKLLGPNSCGVTALGPVTIGVNANSATAQANWTPASLGDYYWATSYSGDLNNLPASGGCPDNAERVHVSPANKPTPTLSTVDSPQTGTVGQAMAVFDTASLSGCFNNVCSGTITFAVVGPNSCSKIALGPATYQVANNSYKAVGIWVPLAGGDYYWSATYSGDADNNPVGPVGCGDAKELIQVPTPPPPPNNPNIIALAINGVATVGHVVALQDTANLSGCSDSGCSGTVTFTLVGPNSCVTSALGPITAGVVANSAVVQMDWTPDTAGDYYWTATYSGDGSNNPISPAVGCGDAVQLVHVNVPPDAGPIKATPNPADVGQKVTLSASPSGGNGSYSYAWSLTPPPGSAASLSSPSDPSPTFTADLAGSYLVALTVTDGNGVASPAANLTVIVAIAP